MRRKGEVKGKKGAIEEKSLRREQDSERKDVDETNERFGGERIIRSEK